MNSVTCAALVDLTVHLADYPMANNNMERTRERLRQGVDWDHLFSMAKRHAVLPLVAANLTSRLANDITDSVAGEANRVLAAGVLRTDHHLAQLREVSALLSAEAIRSATMKGPVFAATTYGSPALRQSEDLDILVGAVRRECHQ